MNNIRSAIANPSKGEVPRRPSRHRWSETLMKILIFVALIAGWEAIIWWMEVPTYVVPAPSDVLVALINGVSSGIYLTNAWITLVEALGGFLIAAVMGIVIGALVAQFGLVETLVYPYLIALQSLPKIAIAPLIILWFGFGIPSKVIVAATVAFFPVLVNVIVGLKTVDSNKIDLMRSLNASRWQIFTKIRFPNALPFVFAGLDVAIIFSILGAIVGEFVGSQGGLGNLIVQLNFNLDVPGVFGALVFLSLMGLGLHAIMTWVRRRYLFWSEPERVIGL